MDTLRAPDHPRTRLTKLHEQHAIQAFLFATRLTGDPAVAAKLTDDALIKLGARFADRRHPDAFGQDLRRAIVHLACSRRARGPKSRNEVLGRAAATLLADEGFTIEQAAAVLDHSTKRVARLLEHEAATLTGTPLPDPIAYAKPSPNLLRRWRVARFRSLLMALLVVAGSGVGGWRTYAVATRSSGPAASPPGNSPILEQRQPVITARIPLTGPGLEELFPYNGPGEMAAADGVVWVAGHFGIVGIDTATNKIARVMSRPEGIGFGGGLAAGDGTVLVAEGNSALIELPGGILRMAPGSATVADSFGLEGMTGPHGVAIGEGAGWLAALNIGVYRLDLDDMDPVATVPMPNPQAVEVGYGAVWAITGGGDIARIDTSTNSIVERFPVPGLGIAIGEGAVWVLHGGKSYDGTHMDEPPGLTSIDPDTNEIGWFQPMTAHAIAAGAGAVWTLEHDRSIGSPSTLRKIDPDTGEILSELDLGNVSAVDLCVLGDSVWVLDRLEPSLIRIDV